MHSASFEYLARKCHGLEMAFRNCRLGSDGCSAGATGGFKSNVNWPAAHRIDPTPAYPSKLRVRPVDEELLGEMEREALFLTVENQSGELRKDSSYDPLNP